MCLLVSSHGTCFASAKFLTPFDPDLQRSYSLDPDLQRSYQKNFQILVCSLVSMGTKYQLTPIELAQSSPSIGCRFSLC